MNFHESTAGIKQIERRHMVRALLTAAVIAAAMNWAPAASADPVGIAGTSWRFVEIMGAAPPATVKPTLELSADGAARGNSGCNDFSGHYVSAGVDLTFSDIGYTKMMCAAEVMAVERGVQSALRRTSRTATAPGELDLLAPDGTVLARLAAVT